MVDLETLQEIGLSKGETKVYLALCKLGMCKTGVLAKEANVSSSKVYKILDRLENKGFVGHSFVGKIKHFKATEPKRILDYMEDKEKEIIQKKELVKKILPELELEQSLSKENTKVTLFHGFKAVSHFFLNILDELKAGDAYYVIGAGYGRNTPEIKPFFYNFHKQRAERKIKVMMLANADTRGLLVDTTKACSEIRFLPQYFITSMCMVFYKEKVFIFTLTKDMIGFLIESKEVGESFKAYFDTFWKIAKE